MTTTMTRAANPARTAQRAHAPYVIREARTKADLIAIARLRNEVYVLEMGRSQEHANLDAGTVIDPLDVRGIVLGAFTSHGRAIGTLRLNAVKEDVPFLEIYGAAPREHKHPGRVFLATKFLVAPDRRRRSLAIELIRFGQGVAKARGWQFRWLDANDHLVGVLASLVEFLAVSVGQARFRMQAMSGHSIAEARLDAEESCRLRATAYGMLGSLVQ